MKRKTKKQTMSILLAIGFLAISGLNVSAASTDLVAASSCNRYCHNYSGSWSRPDYSELYYNNGVYTRVEYTGKEVAIETYDSSFKITSSKKVSEMPLDCFMGSYMGSTYNFLVYGINRTVTLNMTTENTCCVVKYDKSWNELGKYYYQSTAAHIGAQDVTDFAENGDILYIEATETRSNGHEFSICLEFDSADNTLTKSVVGESRSHRMSSYVMYDGDSLVTVTHSDNDPRGVGITRTEVAYGTKSEGCRSSVYKLPDAGSTKENFTGTTVGGLLATDKHYLVAYSCMKEKYKLGEKTDNSSYIELARVNKDALDVDIILNYSTVLKEGTDLISVDLGTSTFYTICPYIVHWKDDKYVIIWDSGSPQGVNYVIYSDNTQSVSDVKTLSEPTLSDATPLSVNGNIVWYATGGIYENGAFTREHPGLPSNWDSIPTFYVLNPETGICATEGHTPKIFTYEEMNPTTTKPETSTENPNSNIDTGKETVDYSKQISAAKKKKAKISKVTNVKGRKIKVTLKKASGYKFQIKVSTSKKFKKGINTYKTSKKIYTLKKKFKKGKTYYLKARTYKKINGKTYYGKWSTIKKVKIKK